MDRPLFARSLACAFAAGIATAQAWHVNYSLETSLGYSDNINQSDIDPTGQRSRGNCRPASSPCMFPIRILVIRTSDHVSPLCCHSNCHVVVIGRPPVASCSLMRNIVIVITVSVCSEVVLRMRIRRHIVTSRIVVHEQHTRAGRHGQFLRVHTA